jgi:pilus assembly protein CpaC
MIQAKRFFGFLAVLAACCGHVPLPAAPAGRVAGGEELQLTVGRSVVLDYPADIGRIATSNPDICDAVAVSNREVMLNAKAQGVSTIIVWPKTGARTLYTVAVEQNLEPVRTLLKETFPDFDIRIQAARDSLSLTGRVPAQTVADRAAALVAPFAKAVVNNIEVVTAEPEKQIMLRVKFAEIDQNVSNSFGVNLVSTGVGNTPGSISTGQFASTAPSELQGGAASTFTISEALNVFAFRPDLNLGAFIQDLETRGLLQVLSQPNLVTTNGKAASFLVGGEFPVPIVQGGANAGAITVTFKEFGIRLTFEPTITEHKTIRMTIKSEDSTIDQTNSVVVSGFTIPALATRRMETNIELGENQSFMIAGLIDDHVSENLSKLPGFANIPILGELFKSRQVTRTKTELIVMVTPEITSPLDPAAAKAIAAMPRKFLAPYLISPGGRAQADVQGAQAGAGKKK